VNCVNKSENDEQSMRSLAARTEPATTVAVLVTDAKSARQIADLFAERFGGDEVAIAMVDDGEGRWCLTVYFAAAPDEDAARALVAAAAGPEAGRRLAFARVAAKDWVGESLAGLKPVPAGRFVVHGAHDRGRVPVNRIGIEIEAALAFGTGHHGTTRGCLLALDRLCKLPARGMPRRMLDLGTGSGVLAIAAARALRQSVLATDIDAGAVRAASDNARLNRAGGLVLVVQANGVTAPAIRACAPFDLVFANILLGPLQRLATPLRQILAPGGRIVLSGILAAQANAALAAYRGVALERRMTLDGWTTLVLRRGYRRHPVVARHRPRS
jgi:ribosomal protein L11 methyltransferase